MKRNFSGVRVDELFSLKDGVGVGAGVDVADEMGRSLAIESPRSMDGIGDPVTKTTRYKVPKYVGKGYPLLMIEIIDEFGILSAALQRLLFRASRRVLDVPDRAVATLETMFKEDQKAYHYGEHKSSDNTHLIQSYKAQVAEASFQDSEKYYLCVWRK